jgi:hypothetical protein
MEKTLINTYDAIMNSNINPLSNIPDNSVRHLAMQVLAWMWCIVFSFYVGSITIFGYTAIAHALLIGAVFATVGTFKVAGSNPNILVSGYHTMSRARKYMWIDGKRYTLPDNDPGGEHI